MKRIRVRSGMVYSLAYNGTVRVLEVIFNTGEIYHYFEVPQWVFDGLMKAESIGQFMRENVLQQYDCKKRGKLDPDQMTDPAPARCR